MNYQKVLMGVAIGSAVAGLGFILLHPDGKKLRKKVADAGLDAADKFIDVLRTAQHPAAVEEPATDRIHASSKEAES